jgi:transposase-like protein
MLTPRSPKGPETGRLPLCARYDSVHVGLLELPLAIGRQHRTDLAPWALGATSDGDLEVVGVWTRLTADPRTAENIASDLVVRGVEGVHVLFHDDCENLTTECARAFPGVVSIGSLARLRSACVSLAKPRHRLSVSKAFSALLQASSHEEAVTQLTALEGTAWLSFPEVGNLCRRGLSRSRAYYALPKRVRLLSQRADVVARQLQCMASAALRRRGDFVSQEDAVAFGQSWLVQAERRLRRSAIPTLRRHPVVAALGLAGPIELGR